MRDGDLIKIGRTIFKFLTGNNIENAYHEELYRLTTTDGLTQIFNKRHLRQTLEREFSFARRNASELSLLMFDIDHFKKINDTHGHLAGDHVLKALADAVALKVHEKSCFGRYGGEEFAIVMPGFPAAEARVLGETIRQAVAATAFAYDDKPISVTVSVGVASFGPTLKNADGLISLADAALYEAKSQGRNRVVESVAQNIPPVNIGTSSTTVAAPAIKRSNDRRRPADRRSSSRRKS